MNLREDAHRMIRAAIDSALPDTAVKKALSQLPECQGKLYLVAIGKAAWQMAAAAKSVLGNRLAGGVCITKYGHIKGKIEGIRCLEAGHPIPDENSIAATREAEKLVEGLTEKDQVVFLISGGGSALFEDPKIPLEELQKINESLLASGADITEINTIRKRLSRVKGGRFAKMCEPAGVFSIILSDIIGDPLDMIASGPAYPDLATAEDAMRIAKKYVLALSETALECMREETPKTLPNVISHVNGSVKQLCAAAAEEAAALGYEPVILTDCIDCEAKAAGEVLSAIARSHAGDQKNLAFIMGGETVVRIKGRGLGGRNQELALAAASGISGLENVCVFSVGSDGTDGPTEAAGGIVDGSTSKVLAKKGIMIREVLEENDSYHALQQCDGLVITGPTGTNVNDVAALLIKGN